MKSGIENETFRVAASVLAADTDDLVELAKITGYPPKVLFANADLSGVDLRSQDIRFLVGLNADCRNAILTSEQRQFLRDQKSEYVDSDQRNMRAQIAALRAEIIEKYLRSTNVFEADHPIFESVLKPIRNSKNVTYNRTLDAKIVELLITSLSDYWDEFKSLNAQKAFFKTLASARYRLFRSTFKLIKEHTSEILNNYPDTNLIPLDNCSAGFLTEMLLDATKNNSIDFNFYASRFLEQTSVLSDPSAQVLFRNVTTLKLRAEVCSFIQDSNFSADQTSFCKMILEQTHDQNSLRIFAESLSSSPTIRLAYLRLAMRSPNLEIVLAALRHLHHGNANSTTIELSDIVYNMSKYADRVSFARRTETLLNRHQHRIIVEEVEKAAFTPNEKRRIRQIWPHYF